jgi:hypothetical protein
MTFNRLLKKIISISSKFSFWIFLLILITSIVFIPALKMKFWWVDDGWTIMTAQKIVDSIVHFNFGGLGIIFNEPGGRFRVIYWLFQTFTYLISGTNPTIYFIIHYLVILLSVYFIFRIVLYISKSNISAFVSSILYVLSPINTENIYRLGPQEPILCLFIIISIYFLIRNKTFLSILFFLFATLSKENGFILWIPVFCFYVGKRILTKKRDQILEKYCIWGLIFSVPFIINIFLRHTGYSGFYTFDINQIISNFNSYIYLVNVAFAPLLIIFIVSYLVRTIICFINNRFKKYRLGILFQAMFIILFLLFIVVQTPWEFVLNRYAMPATIGLAIFMGLEIAGIKDMLKIFKIRWLFLLSIAFGIYFFTYIWMNMMHVYLSGQLQVHQTRYIQSLYQDLATNIQPNGIVLLNFLQGDSTSELVAQTKMQLDLFYNRPDIQVSYLNLDGLPKKSFMIVGTPQVREEYPLQVVEKRIGKYRKDESLIQGDRFLVLTTPMELIKQIIKKVYLLIIHKTPLTGEGIYTFYISRDYWYKYYVGK